MKMKLHRLRLQFRTRRCFAADWERAPLVECKHGLRTAWHLNAKSRAAIALIGALAFTILSAHAQAPTAPPAAPVPPPAGPAKVGAPELEKLLMPIALYSDALIATLLPACVYPLEIVQAARFLQDPNNVSKIDQQPWDESVKAIAKVPAALKKLNDDLQWTIQLGEVFLNQDKDVMDMIQSLRMKAQKAGTLRTTEQQVVVVTNMIVETKVEERVVVVTNTVVQIQPSRLIRRSSMSRLIRRPFITRRLPMFMIPTRRWSRSRRAWQWARSLRTTATGATAVATGGAAAAMT
jgi:hypothetical protein